MLVLMVKPHRYLLPKLRLFGAGRFVGFLLTTRPKRRIDMAATHQLFMFALFDKASMIHDKDAVAVRDGLQAVRDGNYSSVMANLAQGLVHVSLSPWIQR